MTSQLGSHYKNIINVCTGGTMGIVCAAVQVFLLILFCLQNASSQCIMSIKAFHHDSSLPASSCSRNTSPLPHKHTHARTQFVAKQPDAFCSREHGLGKRSSAGSQIVWMAYNQQDQCCNYFPVEAVRSQWWRLADDSPAQRKQRRTGMWPKQIFSNTVSIVSIGKKRKQKKNKTVGTLGSGRYVNLSGLWFLQLYTSYRIYITGWRLTWNCQKVIKIQSSIWNKVHILQHLVVSPTFYWNVRLINSFHWWKEPGQNS